MDAVAEVKARLSIEDVISEYVALKRAGRNFKGLSPFSNEKTPSFVVSPEKQIWHDFSSGRGGDMFTFVQEVEGLDFKGTLELLARKAGIDLEQFGTGRATRGPDKERLYAALDAAAKFYQVQFSANKEAINYILKIRGYTKATVLEFRLGYSPNTDRPLSDYLLRSGFNEQEIKLSGLSTVRRDQPSDMFRGRIMVPLMDGFGRVIGFTARLLADEPNAPKYINTPSTPLYDKSRHVFGLHLAKKAIRDQKFSVIVEGNMDVIASHQAGVRGVVATAGTALTEGQLKALSRLAPEPTQGAEISKVRPCIVVSPDEMNAYRQTVIVVPLTSNIQPLPFRLSLNILGQKSSAACDRIRSVDKSRLRNYIGPLSSADQGKLFSPLQSLLSE